MDTASGEVQLGESTFDVDLYKRFFIEDGELAVGGGSVGGHLKYELEALNQSADSAGAASASSAKASIRFCDFRKRTSVRSRGAISLLSGRWDDNGTAFISDTDHDTMTIIELAWGLELRHRFGRLEDKYWYIDIVPEFQRRESASLPGRSIRAFKVRISISAWRGNGSGRDAARLATVGLHVVAPERAPVVDVEPAVGDDRVRPALPSAVGQVGRCEVAVLAVAFGRRLDESDSPFSPCR